MPTFVSHDGARLHYDVLGNSTSDDPIMVLAGGAARHPDYLGNLAGLDSIRSLLVVHQRGVGRSSSADVPRASWPELAHDVEALRQHLGGSSIDVLGHSAGTRVALAYAASHPGGVRRMCLVTPPALYLVDADDDRESMIQRRRDEPWFDAYRRAQPALMAAKTFEEYVAVADAAAPLGWATWDDRARRHETAAEWYADAATAYFSAPPTDMAAKLAAVTAPVLVIAGAQDAVTGLEPVLTLARLFPSGTSVVVEDAGHYPWIERPFDFRAAVDPFFTAPLSLGKGRSTG